MKKVSTIREQIYQLIKDAICSEEYPAGLWLQEQTLAERYSVSRSPVREALRQLAVDGLVTEVPNKGVYVREMTLREVQDLFDVRIMLEDHTLTHISAKARAALTPDLQRIVRQSEQAYADGDLQQFITLDKEIHTLLIDMCENSLIREIYETISARSSRFRATALTAEGRWAASVEEHRSIVNAILAGDANQAQQHNRHHMEMAKQCVVRHLSGE